MMKKKIAKKKKEILSDKDWHTWRPQLPIVFVNWKTRDVGIYYSVSVKPHTPATKGPNVIGLD